MRTLLRYLTPLIAAACAAAAILAAPTAAAQPEPPLPSCTTVGGDEATGGATTECATPGNVQLNVTPPEPVYPYPWDDEFYGSALIIGGGHGGGGGDLAGNGKHHRRGSDQSDTKLHQYSPLMGSPSWPRGSGRRTAAG